MLLHAIMLDVSSVLGVGDLFDFDVFSGIRLAW